MTITTRYLVSFPDSTSISRDKGQRVCLLARCFPCLLYHSLFPKPQRIISSHGTEVGSSIVSSLLSWPGQRFYSLVVLYCNSNVPASGEATLKFLRRGWRVGSATKSTCCSFKRPWSNRTFLALRQTKLLFFGDFLSPKLPTPVLCQFYLLSHQSPLWSGNPTCQYGNGTITNLVSSSWVGCHHYTLWSNWTAVIHLLLRPAA